MLYVTLGVLQRRLTATALDQEHRLEQADTDPYHPQQLGEVTHAEQRAATIMNLIQSVKLNGL